MTLVSYGNENYYDFNTYRSMDLSFWYWYNILHLLAKTLVDVTKCLMIDVLRIFVAIAKQSQLQNHLLIPTQSWINKPMRNVHEAASACLKEFLLSCHHIDCLALIKLTFHIDHEVGFENFMLCILKLIQFGCESVLGSVESMTKLESMDFDHQRKINGYSLLETARLFF